MPFFSVHYFIIISQQIKHFANRQAKCSNGPLLASLHLAINGCCPFLKPITQLQLLSLGHQKVFFLFTVSRSIFLYSSSVCVLVSVAEFTRAAHDSSLVFLCLRVRALDHSVQEIDRIRAPRHRRMKCFPATGKFQFLRNFGLTVDTRKPRPIDENIYTGGNMHDQSKFIRSN